jgi:hypothetical protein
VRLGAKGIVSLILEMKSVLISVLPLDVVANLIVLGTAMTSSEIREDLQFNARLVLFSVVEL